jgi:hypothetical protein
VLDELDDGALGGVAEDEELDEPDGGVTVAEPETELPLDGELGVLVDEDEDAVSRGADGEVVLDDEVRWLGPRSQAARPRAIATAIARVVNLMRPPWVVNGDTGKAVAVSVPGTEISQGLVERLGMLDGCDCDWSAVLPADEDLFWSGPRLQAESENTRDRAAAIAASFM